MSDDGKKCLTGVHTQVCIRVKRPAYKCSSHADATSRSQQGHLLALSQDMLWSMLPWGEGGNSVRMPRKEVATAVRLAIFGLGVGIAILVSCVQACCAAICFSLHGSTCL